VILASGSCRAITVGLLLGWLGEETKKECRFVMGRVFSFLTRKNTHKRVKVGVFVAVVVMADDALNEAVRFALPVLLNFWKR